MKKINQIFIELKQTWDMWLFLIALMSLGIFIGLNAHAEENLELIGPGVTWNVMDNGKSNQDNHTITSNGRLVYTPEIGFRKIHVHDKSMGYQSFTAFTAQNAIGSPIYGAYGGAGIKAMDMIYLGVAYGGYIQNNEDFRYKGMQTASASGTTNAFVPILGFEVDSHFDLDKSLYIGWNNLISPIIMTSGLSIGWRY